MSRLVNAHTGVVVNVDDEFAERLRGAAWVDAESEGQESEGTRAPKRTRGRK